jgi:hypothetical protein
MVALLEIVVLIICLVLGVWWFSRSSVYRSRFRSPDPLDQSDGARESLAKLPPKGGGPEYPSDRFPSAGS